MTNQKPDCTRYCEGRCMHSDAPFSLFSTPKCILDRRKSKDPRVVHECALRIPQKRKLKPPMPPREWMAKYADPTDLPKT